MPRMPSPSTTRLTRDGQRLVALTQALARSGSRLEDVYWENLLAAQLHKLLQGKKNQTVETVLERLLATDLNAYEILVEQVETLSESTTITYQGMEYDALLFSAPVVAWTRYQLPNGELTESQHQALTQGLQTHVVAEQASVALVPVLVNFDQMPQSFQETHAWTQRLGLLALGAPTEAPQLNQQEDPESMLADARFVVGAIVAPKGQALFRWQTPQEDAIALRKACQQAWEKTSSDIITPLFTGCHIEYLQPDAYYINNREADRRIRPLALKAAVAWLQTAAHLSGDNLRAVITGCGETTIEEYRIGFSTRSDNEVIYGCIWPVLSKEEAAAEFMEGEVIDIPDEITALLKEQGISDVCRLPGVHPAEFCDDCGAPYFPNSSGEMMHPELPDEIDMAPVHFH